MLRCIPCVGKTSLRTKFGHGKCNGLHVPPSPPVPHVPSPSPPSPTRVWAVGRHQMTGDR